MTPDLVEKLLNSLGLLFDMIGAVLVAFELVRQFKGNQMSVGQTINSMHNPPIKTPEFKKWEVRKYRYMAVGLAFLLLGFSLQLVANWVSCFYPSLILFVNQ